MEQNRPIQQVSCLFWYKVRAYRDGKALSNRDGSPRFNDNYISFLQVISCFWECIDDSGPEDKYQLNIFLNGGSASLNRTTGETIYKPGYSLQLMGIVAQKFMDNYYNWSTRFGLTQHIPTASPARIEGVARRTTRFKEEDFIDPTEETTSASWEVNEQAQ